MTTSSPNNTEAEEVEGGPDQLERKLRALDEALEQLNEAAPFAKARYQTQVYRLATELMSGLDGMEALVDRMGRFVEAGGFHGGPWDDPSKLLPHLVGIGLKGDGVYSTVEALSELRMVALATGRATDERISAEGATGFLREICAHNLELMFPEPSEETRARPNIFRRAERLFRLICDEISVTGLRQKVVEEVELICAQRPIITRRVVQLLDRARRLPSPEGDEDARLERLIRATGAATEAAAEAGEPGAYLKVLRSMDAEELQAEARRWAESLESTGLGSPFHAVLLRWVAKRSPELLETALGVNAAGAACVSTHQELTAQLVRVAIFPAFPFSIFGLKSLLERSLLSRTEVASGLRRLIDIDITTEPKDRLLALCPPDAGVGSNSILMAGAVSVLGLPLGVGQGNNPTCQAARGLSLWSQHAPGLLLGMIATAVRDGFVRMDFENQALRSDQLPDADPSRPFDAELDPVSAVLVPHLDRIYARMIQLSLGRGEDTHKWVNPAMYGRWVAKGFTSTFHPVTGAVTEHNRFVRRFYSTHHPEYNDGYELIYPNPVGLIVTDVHGNMLGPHAVSIQRIATAPDGELRVYFFNPNNEGRQRWGHGVAPTVWGHGEIPGESSLPFDQFASRLYAFHFDPYEEGEAYAVPEEVVEQVSSMARESWGQALTWIG